MSPAIAIATGAAVLAAAVAAWPATAPRVPPGRREQQRGDGPLARLGRWCLSRLAPGAPPPAHRTARRAGAVLAAAVLVAPVAPQVLVGSLAWWTLVPRLRAARSSRRHEAAVAEGLPDAIDLLRLAVGAGYPVPLALPLVADRSAGPVAAALASAERHVAAGAPRADAVVSELAPLGTDARSFAHVLADHLRHGTPLEPVLDRLSFEARVARRHRAEQAARRVPVRLLLPLVLCILPAFGLLTVAPLLAGSLRSLTG